MFAEDRVHEEAASEVVISILPSFARKSCLELFADSIDKAHIASPKSWGVTLFPNLIRLNVGMVEACFLSNEQIYLTLLRDNLTEQTFQNKILTFNMYDPKTKEGVYKSVPGSLGCSFNVKYLSAVIELLLPAHNTLIQRAAQTRRHSKTKNAHSSGVLKYLRTELNRVIPDPLYASV